MDSQALLNSQFLPVNTALDQSKPTRIKGKVDDRQKDLKRLEELKKACADFESIFTNSLIKAMRNSIPDSGFLKNAPGHDLYESMADEQLALYLTQGQGRGMGLAQAIFNQVANREGLEELAAQHPHLGGLEYQKTIPPAQMKKVLPGAYTPGAARVDS